jgi:NAD(P)-dependent dehydrogenase (short-subunit alcohol dehydrogenase family)
MLAMWSRCVAWLHCCRRFGGIDILVNNAAIGLFASVSDITPEQWMESSIQTLPGVLLLPRRHSVPQKRGGGTSSASAAGREESV